MEIGWHLCGSTFVLDKRDKRLAPSFWVRSKIAWRLDCRVLGRWKSAGTAIGSTAIGSTALGCPVGITIRGGSNVYLSGLIITGGDDVAGDGGGIDFKGNGFLELSTFGLGAGIGGLVTLPVIVMAVGDPFVHDPVFEVDIGSIEDFPEGEFMIATFFIDRAAGEVSRRTAYVPQPCSRRGQRQCRAPLVRWG